MAKKVLVVNGGGDCPGLNAVIRAIVKRASREEGWEVWGSIQAYNGLLWDPQELIRLDRGITAGIHAKGGTILQTTNKGGPFAWPVQREDGSWTTIDRSDELIEIIQKLGIEAVISIGGDGSQQFSKQLYDKGLNIVGVPKTIDNDLSATDITFGFQTAVQIATESVDKLVTTAASHNRVMILEVMGRDAGWIALHAAIAGGAEVCLIPEIPYDIKKVVERVNKRYKNGRGFVNIVISEGAHSKGGAVVSKESKEIGYAHDRLGGVAYQLQQELKTNGCIGDTRVTVLGHIQRGGVPNPYDRVLASCFGVKAFEMVLEKTYGCMVSYRNNQIIHVSLEEATAAYNFVNPDSYLVRTAKGLGISFGD